jgi:hypothetical protein
MYLRRITIDGLLYNGSDGLLYNGSDGLLYNGSDGNFEVIGYCDSN